MKLFLLIPFLLLPIFLKSQVFVDMTPQNKNVLIEEFTGVQCGGCTYGHQEVEALLNAYPGRVFAARMHSEDIGHTDPYGSDPNLAREFPDQLYSEIPDLTGIPAGIVSRAYFNGSLSHVFMPFSPYHETLDSAINQHLSTSSPINLGLEAIYDSSTKQLSVHVQAYTTANCVGNYNLGVYFTESNILTSQWNGSAVLSNYNQKHVFREILTPAWGEAIVTGSEASGVLIDKQYSFDNSVALYNMQNVEIIVFVTNNTYSSMGDVIQAYGDHPDITGQVVTAVTKKQSEKKIHIYPNPSQNGQFQINLAQNEPFNIIMIQDVQGKTVFEQLISTTSELIEPQLEPGVYTISLKDQSAKAQKIIVY